MRMNLHMDKAIRDMQRNMEKTMKHVRKPYKSRTVMRFPKKKKMTYPMASIRYGLRPFGDRDRDGVANVFDCKPYDIKKQDARWCADIGMFTIDRPKQSCRHATPFCAEHCYNKKMYKVFKGMKKKDVRNEQDWKNWSGRQWKEHLDKKRKQTSRVRLMSRGEAFSDDKDVERVKDILEHNPKRTFWIPTRAWHDPHLKQRIEQEVESYPNVRVLYSTDPSDFETGEYEKTKGHNTMFFGDDDIVEKGDSMGRKFVKCEKTYEHKKDVCPTCEEGCFKKDEEVHIHLKEH